MKKLSKVLSIILVLAMLASGIGQAVQENDIKTNRVFGDNRYATAAGISIEAFPNGTNNIVIAYGKDFPDALAGSSLAAAYDAPILLTKTEALPKETISEVKRLGAKKAFVLGGSSVISNGVVRELEGLGVEVERLGGTNRYETAALIAEKVYEKKGVRTAALISGSAYADGMSIGSYAGLKGYQVLYVKPKTVPNETLKALENADEVLLIGGESVINESVKGQLSGKNIERIKGDNRFATSVAIANKFGSLNNGIIANSHDFADALVASLLGAKLNAPILLSKADKLSPEVKSFIDIKGLKMITIIGGKLVISQKVIDQILGNFVDNEPIKINTVEVPGPDSNETSVGMAGFIYLLNNKKIFAVKNHPQYISSGVLYLSEDGGSNYNKVIDGVASLRGIHFANDQIGYVVGGASGYGTAQYVGKTTDGGKTWTEITHNLLRDVNEIWVDIPRTTRSVNVVTLSPEEVYVISSHSVYGSVNGGESWTLVGGRKSRVYETKAYLYTGTLKTVNGIPYIGTYDGFEYYPKEASRLPLGEWTKLDAPWNQEEGLELVSLEFKDNASRGWALVHDKNMNMYILYKTDNFGQSWEVLNRNSKDDNTTVFPKYGKLTYFKNILFAERNYGELIHSVDGGVTWELNDWKVGWLLDFHKLENELRIYSRHVTSGVFTSGYGVYR